MTNEDYADTILCFVNSYNKDHTNDILTVNTLSYTHVCAMLSLSLDNVIALTPNIYFD